jgi:hypothetical protein
LSFFSIHLTLVRESEFRAILNFEASQSSRLIQSFFRHLRATEKPSAFWRKLDSSVISSPTLTLNQTLCFQFLVSVFLLRLPTAAKVKFLFFIWMEFSIASVRSLNFGWLLRSLDLYRLVLKATVHFVREGDHLRSLPK